MSKEGALKKYGISILVTVSVIAVIFLFGHAYGLILTLEGLPAVIVAPGAVTFFLNFDLGPGELIPGGFVLNINGETCSFNSDAVELGGPLCPSIACTVIKKSGFMFGTFNANGTVDGYGYGYGYKYGYGYGDGELRYQCTKSYPCTASGVFPVFFSTTIPPTTFTSATKTITVLAGVCPRPGGGSGGAGAQGFCCDPIVNFAEWHCCQKAYIARIQCCAQPQHPDCARYCKLLRCIPPYVMDIGAGRCIMPSQFPPGFGNASGVGSGGSGQATAGGGGGGGGSSGGSGQGGGDSEGFMGLSWEAWLAIILALLGLAGLAYFLSRRRV